MKDMLPYAESGIESLENLSSKKHTELIGLIRGVRTKIELNSKIFSDNVNNY